MIWKTIGSICMIFWMVFSVNAHALEEETSVLTPVLPEPQKGYWIFSGLVNNESQEVFGYFFQMERQDNQFHMQTAVMDERSGKVLFHYEQTENQENPTDFNWKVGHAFLRFNPINESWIFGVKMPDKAGFNFKIDMLTQPVGKRETQTLSPGLEALVHQTGRLDGLLQLESDNTEQFVSSSNAWFSKIWVHDHNNPHMVNTGFCRFKDGAGFYTGNVEDTDARLATFASFRDAEGKTVKMSQFAQIHSKDNQTWKVNLPIPRLAFDLNNSLTEKGINGIAAGFSQDKRFCFFSQQTFGETAMG